MGDKLFTKPRTFLSVGCFHFMFPVFLFLVQIVHVVLNYELLLSLVELQKHILISKISICLVEKEHMSKIHQERS